MDFDGVSIKVKQKILNKRRVFEFYGYTNVHKKYTRDKVVLTARIDRRSRPVGVTVHFYKPGRTLFARNSIRYTEGVVLELHGFTPSLYCNRFDYNNLSKPTTK